MEYGLIRISETKESFIEDLLFSLAGYVPEQNPIYGYQCEVKGSLKDMLCFLSEEEDEFKCTFKEQLFRVYACMDDSIEDVLVAGDSLQIWGKTFFRERSSGGSILSMHISPSYPSDLDWGLIGIAAPGWVLLFEEDLDHAVRDRLTENIEVGYVPAEELFLDSSDPSLSTQDLLLVLLQLILQNLTVRDTRDDDRN